MVGGKKCRGEAERNKLLLVHFTSILLFGKGGEDTYPSNFPEKLSANCVALFSLCNSVNPSSQYYITFAVLFIFFFALLPKKKKEIPISLVDVCLSNRFFLK